MIAPHTQIFDARCAPDMRSAQTRSTTGMAGLENNSFRLDGKSLDRAERPCKMDRPDTEFFDQNLFGSTDLFVQIDIGLTEIKVIHRMIPDLVSIRNQLRTVIPIHKSFRMRDAQSTSPGSQYIRACFTNDPRINKENSLRAELVHHAGRSNATRKSIVKTERNHRLIDRSVDDRIDCMNVRNESNVFGKSIEKRSKRIDHRIVHMMKHENLHSRPAQGAIELACRAPRHPHRIDEGTLRAKSNRGAGTSQHGRVNGSRLFRVHPQVVYPIGREAA